MAKFRLISLLPSTITLTSAICGFGAIVAASHVSSSGYAYGFFGEQEASLYLQIAGWLILAAWFFDGIDGRVARLTNTVSPLGGELDSLSDMVACGVAPAFVLYKLGPGPGSEHPVIHVAFIVAAIFYLSCTAIRLARFNIQEGQSTEKAQTFTGLPCPAAAGCIAALAISQLDFHNLIVAEDTTIADSLRLMLPLATIMLSLLMVSRIPYSKIATPPPRGLRWITHLVALATLVIAVLLFREALFAFVFWGFAFLEPVHQFARQFFQVRDLPDEDEGLGDAEPAPERAPVDRF